MNLVPAALTVFNNRFSAGLLYLCGWFEPDGGTANEGIRIAAIVGIRLRDLRMADGELFEGTFEITDTSLPTWAFDRKV